MKPVSVDLATHLNRIAELSGNEQPPFVKTVGIRY